jgi:8-oxo-dGTP pyrophosphatase MutT (NUDIX family)
VTSVLPASHVHAAASDVSVIPIARLQLTFAPCAWPFAEAWRSAIDAHFTELRRRKPALWNGRVLVMHQFTVDGDAFRGAYLETDYGSFLAWRDCFGMGAVRSSDGAFLLGVMGCHTANAGQTYFPAGTADPDDVVDGKVDLEGSVRRELAEETGLDADRMAAESGWHAVFAGSRIAMMKLLQADESADALRQRALLHLAGQAQPELADVRIVRDRADIDASIPAHVGAFLEYVWRVEGD